MSLLSAIEHQQSKLLESFSLSDLQDEIDQKRCKSEHNNSIQRPIINVHSKSSSYKCRKSYERRKQESDYFRYKYPDKIAIIVERFKSEKTLPNIDKRQFLVPAEITAGQLINVIRERLNVDTRQVSLYLFVNNRIIPSVSITAKELSMQYCDADGFVYLQYSSHECMG